MGKEDKKITRKETDTEMLARMMVHGFDHMDKRFEQVDKRFEQVDKRFEQVDERLGYIGKEIVALNHAQDETNRRLTSIERKHTGLLESDLNFLSDFVFLRAIPN